MIYCKINDLHRYLGLSERLDKAIRYICARPEVHIGRNEISGDSSVYANRFDYETKPCDAELFETHLRYADIHVLLSGQEMIYAASLDSLAQTEAREADDFIGAQGAWQSAFKMTPSRILIVFPGEAHKTQCALGTPCAVEKLVVKILMDEDRVIKEQ